MGGADIGGDVYCAVLLIPVNNGCCGGLMNCEQETLSARLIYSIIPILTGKPCYLDQLGPVG